MKDKFLLRSIILIILLTTAGTIHAQITGSGTANYIPKFSGTSTIGNSIIYQKTITGFTSSDTYIGIGTTNPSAQLHVNGSIKLSGKIDGARTSEYLGIYANGGVNYGAGIELAPDGLTAKEGMLSLYAGKGNGTPGGIKFYNYTTTYSLKCNMQINNKGNVGIGLLNIAPAYRLDVKDSINDTLVARIVNRHANGKGLLVVGGSLANNNTVFELQNAEANSNSLFSVLSGGTVNIGSGMSKITLGDAGCVAPLWDCRYIGFNAERTTDGSWTINSNSGRGDNGGGIIYTSCAGDMNFVPIYTNNPAGGTRTLPDDSIAKKIAFTIGKTGMIGIGTTNPQTQLEIRNNNGESKVLTYSPNAQMWVANSQYGYGMGVDAAGKGYLYGNYNTPQPLMTFYNSNVGIGTTTPGDYKLAVAGKIHCTEVVVEALSSWPDYVFDKGYKLMPVKELEQYVTANKHLPGIPDAQTVSEKGVSVGEMNAQLLKKVEELTQYIILLNQRIEKLESQNTNH